MANKFTVVANVPPDYIKEGKCVKIMDEKGNDLNCKALLIAARTNYYDAQVGDGFKTTNYHGQFKQYLDEKFSHPLDHYSSSSWREKEKMKEERKRQREKRRKKKNKGKGRRVGKKKKKEVKLAKYNNKLLSLLQDIHVHTYSIVLIKKCNINLNGDKTNVECDLATTSSSENDNENDEEKQIELITKDGCDLAATQEPPDFDNFHYFDENNNIENDFSELTTSSEPPDSDFSYFETKPEPYSIIFGKDEKKNQINNELLMNKFGFYEIDKDKLISHGIPLISGVNHQLPLSDEYNIKFIWINTEKFTDKLQQMQQHLTTIKRKTNHSMVEKYYYMLKENILEESQVAALAITVDIKATTIYHYPIDHLFKQLNNAFDSGQKSITLKTGDLVYQNSQIHINLHCNNNNVGKNWKYKLFASILSKKQFETMRGNLDYIAKMKYYQYIGNDERGDLINYIWLKNRNIKSKIKGLKQLLLKLQKQQLWKQAISLKKQIFNARIKGKGKCGYCQKYGKIKFCKKCQKETYCTRTCQKKAWNNSHRTVCQSVEY